jgi:hypothetical protein
LTTDVSNRRSPNQSFRNVFLGAGKIPVIKICEAELTLSAVSPFRIAQLSRQRADLCPISPHCGAVDLSIELALDD